ncbi:hypothetical protein D3C73_1147590 [compost metagenome]
MADGAERQRPWLAFDFCLAQGAVDRGRQQVVPCPVRRGARQVVDNKLHDHLGGEGAIAQRLAVTQLQPRVPIGQGAAVAAHRVGGCAGGDKGVDGRLRMLGQFGGFQRHFRRWNH